MSLDKAMALRVLNTEPSTPYCLDCWAAKTGITSAENKAELLAFGQAFGDGTTWSQEIGVCQSCGDGTAFISLHLLRSLERRRQKAGHRTPAPLRYARRAGEQAMVLEDHGVGIAKVL